MADPLSITASIAGPIGLSGQLLATINSLYTFGKSAQNAPEPISRLKEEIESDHWREDGVGADPMGGVEGVRSCDCS
jgi:hypothetical protein